MEIRDIYLFICIVFFYGMFKGASTNNFMWVGVVLTNAADNSIAHKLQKGEQIR